MKRNINLLLTVILLLIYMLVGVTTAYAAEADNSRAIAIVFDNSGSMYDEGDQAWCRATYAMEVFASMMNAGDTLQIYPMHPITVGGKEYSMQNPLQITDAAQASSIRDILTENAGGTPIESINCAIQGLQQIQTGKKYMVVLTDGGTFSKNGYGLSKERTKTELDKLIQANAGEAMTVMYLGIGSEACEPNTAESNYFVKKRAVNTADVLSTLTDMCNLIFGRNTILPNHISGQTIDFDISMKKLIVFVQGNNISDLKVKSESGNAVGKLISSQQTKYSTKGASDYRSVPDPSLQGMIVTYEDCASGTYYIEYSGTADSVEVYYEPDADLEFIFTDSEGNNVDSNSLYEGEYKVSFGMKDAKTGKLISSDLLGNPQYTGTYSINGQDLPINRNGHSGDVPVSLKMNDAFEAHLTVTYLSGYTISKDSSDFGWPEGGIIVLPRPAGNLILEITGGDELYSLQDLESGNPFIAKVYHQGVQLVGNELENVDLKWNPDTSNVKIEYEFADDHYKLHLLYKDSVAPMDTKCGECTVTIYALYSAQGSSESQAQAPLTYNIDEDTAVIDIALNVAENYLVISELEDSKAIEVKLSLNGMPLTPEQFTALSLNVDCGGIEHTVTPNEQGSCYLIKLHKTDGISEGKYSILANAIYTDKLGRTVQAGKSTNVTLSNIPLWVKWAIGLLILLILIIIIWLILHIKVLPTHMHTTKKLSSMTFDGDDVTLSTNFLAEIKKGAKVQAQYAGRRVGISMDVSPGKESYLYKAHKRRSAIVKVSSVRKFGPANIKEVTIGSTKYIADENNRIVPALPGQKPFPLTNGMMVKYSGTIQDAGIDKDFEVISKLNFKKK